MDHDWKKLSIFLSLTSAEFDCLCAVAKRETVAAGTTVFKEGDAATDFYIVAAGQIEIRTRNAAGEVIRLFSLGAGAHFGEMGLLAQDKRSATAVACEPGELLRFVYDDLVKIFEQNPTIGMRVYRAVAQFLAVRLQMASVRLRSASPSSTSLI